MSESQLVLLALLEEFVQYVRSPVAGAVGRHGAVAYEFYGLLWMPADTCVTSDHTYA